MMVEKYQVTTENIGVLLSNGPRCVYSHTRRHNEFCKNTMFESGLFWNVAVLIG